MMMVVAVYFPHNEGRISALIEESAFDFGGLLVDKYEVDAEIKSFDTMDDAKDWLTKREVDVHSPDWKQVDGGWILEEEIE